MARPSGRSPEEKLRIVLAVVRGEVTVAEALATGAGVGDLDREVA